MKAWLNSILLPVLLLIVLAIFTLWFNSVTILEEPLSVNSKETITTMYGARIKSFSMNGELENNIYASKITQNKYSNSFTLEDSVITRYRNGKMIQKVTAKEAQFDDRTKDIKLASGTQEDNREKGKLEIIINEL